MKQREKREIQDQDMEVAARGRFFLLIPLLSCQPSAIILNCIDVIGIGAVGIYLPMDGHNKTVFRQLGRWFAHSSFWRLEFVDEL